jgi:mannose-1-phosphate guanylyltransferase
VKTQPIFGLILAGGQSSRLFPFNKVLSDLTGVGKSLIRQSFDRLKLPPGNTFVLTVQDMVGPMRKELKLSPGNFFVDPVRRGTLPAILWAMAHLESKNPQAVLAIVTADHVILGERAFRDSFEKAVTLAAREPALVMLGISPSRDANEWRSFGCFRVGTGGKIEAFEEKPTVERAEQLLQDKQYFWNSGMFFFRISTAVAALKAFQPGMYRVYESVRHSLEKGNEKEAAFFFEDFPDKIPHPNDPSRPVDNSIDYALMTPLVKNSPLDLYAAAVHDVRFQWTDLGEWTALRKVIRPDRKQNVQLGDVALGKEVRRCILAADAKSRIKADHVQDIAMAMSHQTAILFSNSSLHRIKEVLQAAQEHPEQPVIERDTTECDFQVSGARLITVGVSGLRVILNKNQLKVSGKPGFIQ